MTRTYTTNLGDLATEPVSMADLKVGDQFVSELTATGHRVYEVTGDCASHERGWLYTRDLDIDPTERWSDGTPKCEGFFDYPTTTLMHRVIPA